VTNEDLQRIPDNAGEIMDDLLRNTDTPNLRLFAFLMLRTRTTQILTKALNAGEISCAAATWWLNRLDAFSLSLPSNFVDMLAEVYGVLEQFMREQVDEIAKLNDAPRNVLLKALPYLHEMAFSPPGGHLSAGVSERVNDLRDFVAFVTEFNKETDRGAALVGAALVDSRLESLLRGHLLNEDIAEKLLSNSAGSPLGGFSARIKMCYALGLITEVEFKECEVIRRVRNQFAHQLHGLTYDDQQIADWCDNLKAMTYMEGSARQRFINSVITLCMVLWYRPAHAAPFKAQERKWSWHLAYDK
jgi:mannitol operon repressor